MDAVLILRQLWRQRVLVAVGLVVSLVLGLLVVYRIGLGVPPSFTSRQYDIGVASAEALVDSPSSQVADLGGGPVRTDVVALTARARLLANVMTTSPLKDQIARRAGIDPVTFSASVPSLGPDAAKPQSVSNGPTNPRGNVMTVYFNETLPIITADVQATDAALAARIATAAVQELGTYLKSIAAEDKVPNPRQLVIDELGPARYATQTEGPRPLSGFGAFLLIFGVWCAALLVTSRLVERWREAAAAEASGVPVRQAVAEPTPPPLAEPPSLAVAPAADVPLPSWLPDPPETMAPDPNQARRTPDGSAQAEGTGAGATNRPPASSRGRYLPRIRPRGRGEGARVAAIDPQLNAFLECPEYDERDLQLEPVVEAVDGEPGVSCRCGASFPQSGAEPNLSTPV